MQQASKGCQCPRLAGRPAVEFSLVTNHHSSLCEYNCPFLSPPARPFRPRLAICAERTDGRTAAAEPLSILLLSAGGALPNWPPTRVPQFSNINLTSRCDSQDREKKEAMGRCRRTGREENGEKGEGLRSRNATKMSARFILISMPPPPPPPPAVRTDLARSTHIPIRREIEMHLVDRTLLPSRSLQACISLASE